MNKLIIDNLTKLVACYNTDPKLIFKMKAINKALQEINIYDKIITSGNDAKNNIKYVGEGIAKRIDEILKTGTLQEFDQFNLSNIDNNNVNKKELMAVLGMGKKRAKELIEMGITNITILKEKVANQSLKLPNSILIGLKYLDDFEKRIPRKEIVKIEKILRKTLLELSPQLMMEICGSYRRGAETCGDIDVLITHKDPKSKEEYLEKYVEKLAKKGLLIDHLTKKGNKKYMGVCRLNKTGYARRIDIRFVKYDEFYAALIYFTGSKNFNIKIRNIALEKGYSLNEYSLTVKKTGKKIILHSEKELFQLLEINYVEPYERSI